MDVAEKIGGEFKNGNVINIQFIPLDKKQKKVESVKTTKDFEIINDWNKRGIVLEIKENEEIDSPLRPAKGQNKLKIFQHQSRNSPC